MIMSSKGNDNKQCSSVYQPLESGILNTPDVTESESARIINDLLKNTIPSKDLANVDNKKYLYLNLKKFEPYVKKAKKPVKTNKLTRKDRLNLGVLKCPKTGWNYDELEPLRSMWRQHMKEALDYLKDGREDEVVIGNFHRFASRADLHGAEVVVKRSKNINLVGISGTIVHEGRDTLGVLSKDNRLRTIPKEPCVFNIRVGHLDLVVFGKYLLCKTAERSVKKIKSNIIPTL